MKAHLIFCLSLLLLFSCSVKESTSEQIPLAQTNTKSAEASRGLALNGGERWSADAATNTHMRQLQELMRRHQTLAEPNSVEALHALGQSMDQGFQELFANCRMKGAAHDMLHTYLLPMLEDVKALKTEDATAAARSRDRLAARLAQYQTYFK